MKSVQHSGAAFMDGRTYTIGRDAHIRIDDPCLSRGHAEIQFIDGGIFLRDLNSTNGTYLIKNGEPIRFYRGYVHPNQRFMLGRQIVSIRKLLAMIGIYVSFSQRTGLAVLLTKPHNRRSSDSTDFTGSLEAPR